MMRWFIALASMLVCLFVSQCDKCTHFLCTCIRYRFQTGPGRCTGRAGPHIQSRDWLGLAQCQRDACHWRPGHMKANTLLPRSSSLPSFLLHLNHVPHPVPFHPPPSASSPSDRCWEKEGCMGKSRDRHTVLPPHRLLPSPQGEEAHTVFAYPIFHHPFPPFSSWLLCWGPVFFTVIYETACFVRVHGYGAPMKGVKVWMKNKSESVLSIHFLRWYS